MNLLVLCTGNSCRSQMAEGWLRFFANEYKKDVKVYSAGIETHGLNPDAVFYMKEAGIDISNHTSNNILEYKEIEFGLIFTVCDHAKENCPYFPSNAKRIHHNFVDPSKANKDEKENLFRKVRDEIKNYSEQLIKEIV